MAKENQGKNIDTILFFDEANTTEALSMIKEVMVDRRIRGRRIGLGLERLQFIAACNPYRRRVLEIFFDIFLHLALLGIQRILNDRALKTPVSR